MRKIMQEQTQQLDEAQSLMTERNRKADQLIEKWSRVRGIDLGDKLTEMAQEQPEKARNFALVLENEEKHLKRLTETQISDTFSTTPSNVMRVIRLGYPNSVRSEVFREFSMTHMKETLYKLAPSYGNAYRTNASMNDNLHEADYDSWASEIYTDTVATIASGTVAYADTDGGVSALSVTSDPSAAPTETAIRPFTVKVFAGDTQIGVDDGQGNLVGAGLDAAATNTISYADGSFTITLTGTADDTYDGADLIVEYAFNMENTPLYEDIGAQVELILQGFDFRAHPYPIGFSFSHMAELLAEDALQVDAQEALVQGGADALKKALDYLPLRMAVRASSWTAPVEFDTDFATAGADSDYAHAQSLMGAIENAGNKMYEALNRGGVSVIVGGPKAITYLKKHNLYRPTGQQPAVGAHRVGELDGKPVYKVPSDVVATDRLLCIFKNDREDSLDVPIGIGTYIPLYRTTVNEYQNFTKAGGMAHYGDMKLLQQKYITSVSLTNLPA